MKRLLGILGWAWGISFILFFMATLIKWEGIDLPLWLDQNRDWFQGALESLLSSSLFGVVFVAGWVAFSFYSSKESGWKNLSEEFGSESAKFDFSDKLISASGKIGEINHNGMLKVGGNRFGLVLKSTVPI